MTLDSKVAFEKKYEEGYGIMYPESHIVRIFEHFLRYELGIDGKKGGNFLDFGCGNGTHALYFKTKGFDVYGVDIIESAIEKTKQRLPEQADNFKLIEPNQDIDNLFEVKFNIILANQSLYYLSNTNLLKTVSQLYSMLNDDGVVIFTMMGIKNYYYNFAKESKNDGLQKVNLTGRISDTTHINFIKNRKELLEKFKLFKPVAVGHYDFLLREGSSFHYYFIGKKC